MKLHFSIQDMDLVVGTTARKRTLKQNYYSCEQIIEQIKNKGQLTKNIGIVFGRENSGLTNQELALCDLVSSIPMKTEFPSLNLAQSVMIYAHSLSSLSFEKNEGESSYPETNKLLVIKNRVSELLIKLGVEPTANVFGRILTGIASLNERDLKLVHFLCRKIEKRLKMFGG